MGANILDTDHMPHSVVSYLVSLGKLLKMNPLWLTGQFTHSLKKRLMLMHPGSNSDIGMWQGYGSPSRVLSYQQSECHHFEEKDCLCCLSWSVSSVFSGFLHRVRPEDGNIVAFEKAPISFMRLFCNQSQIYSVLSQFMWKWYFSHMQTVKAPASLRIRAVWPMPSLCAHIESTDQSRHCALSG